jgi:hypothetical protein
LSSAIRRSAFLVLLAICIACGDSRPTAPTPLIAAPPTVVAVAESRFPPLSGPSRTFTFDRSLSYPVSAYTRASRFILYDNGALLLEYPSGGGSYRGAYSQLDGALGFGWDGWSAGVWGATGVLNGDALTVQFDSVMQLSDFENAVYTLTR